MRILDLPLKKQWYNMIESGENPEEYREIKPYWIKRLCNDNQPSSKSCEGCPFGKCGDYSHVRFRYGYTKRIMLFELKSIRVGVGNPKWGAPKEEVFILKLGERIND